MESITHIIRSRDMVFLSRIDHFSRLFVGIQTWIWLSFMSDALPNHAKGNTCALSIARRIFVVKINTID